MCPAVYGWLSLDRRGNWLIKGERDRERSALREFIARNYQADERGRWYFQNGPQRVYVAPRLHAARRALRRRALLDQCGRPFAAERRLSG